MYTLSVMVLLAGVIKEKGKEFAEESHSIFFWQRNDRT